MQVCGILAGLRVDEIETNAFRVPSRINSTWGGSLVDMVRATKILEIIEEDRLLAHVAKTGKHLQTRLHDLTASYPAISNVRGSGLLCAFDFPDAERRNTFLKRGLDHGALFLGCGERSIRFRSEARRVGKGGVST